MFQYATGLSVATKLGTQLELDATSYVSDDKRVYELDQFNVSSDGIKVIHKENLLASLSNKFLFKKFNENYLKSNYDEKYLSIKDNTILDGYWQCGDYFENVKEKVQAVFCVKEKDNSVFSEFAAKIKCENSVSVHIRRGDYVVDDGKKGSHALLDLNYYDNANKWLLKKTSDIKLWIFSDDAYWVKEHFKTELPHEILSDSVELTSAEQIILMSFCSHNIIANSSFSWWAAWLNKNRDKTVIAPKKWFLNNAGIDDKRIPSSWERI